MDIKLFGDKLVAPGSVEGLASRIFKCAVVGSNELKRASEKMVSRPVWLSMVFEYVFFYLALARRTAWAHLPEEKQEALFTRVSDVLLAALVDFVFEDGTDALKRQRVDHLKEELSARIVEYGKYQMMIRESEAEKPEGTALWAFCNKAAALLGTPDDLVTIMVTHGHIYDSMLVIGMDAPDHAM